MARGEIVGGILAGGYAKRLRPLTETVPKPLIEVKDGYTILDKQLLSMKSAGIKKVYLMVGYLKEKIKTRYGSSWRGLRIEYIEEAEPMGTVYGIRELLLNTNYDALIMNGDIITDANLYRMIRRARSLAKPALMLVTRLRSPFGVVEIVGDRIASFKEKPLLDYYVNGGIYVIPNKLKHYFEPYRRGDVERLVFPALAEDGLLYYYKEEGAYWRSIDSLKDIEEVRKEFEGRADYDWGYLKNLAEIGGVQIKKVYVMKDYTAEINTRGKTRIQVLFGRGAAEDSSGNKTELSEGRMTQELRGRIELRGLENLTCQLYIKE